MIKDIKKSFDEFYTKDDVDRVVAGYSELRRHDVFHRESDRIIRRYLPGIALLLTMWYLGQAEEVKARGLDEAMAAQSRKGQNTLQIDSPQDFGMSGDGGNGDDDPKISPTKVYGESNSEKVESASKLTLSFGSFTGVDGQYGLGSVGTVVPDVTESELNLSMRQQVSEQLNQLGYDPSLAIISHLYMSSDATREAYADGKAPRIGLREGSLFFVSALKSDSVSGEPDIFVVGGKNAKGELQVITHDSSEAVMGAAFTVDGGYAIPVSENNGGMSKILVSTGSLASHAAVALVVPGDNPQAPVEVITAINHFEAGIAALDTAETGVFAAATPVVSEQGMGSELQVIVDGWGGHITFGENGALLNKDGVVINGLVFNAASGMVEITRSDALGHDFTEQFDPKLIEVSKDSTGAVDETINYVFTLGENGQLLRLKYKETSEYLYTQNEVLKMIAEDHSAAPGADLDTLAHAEEIFSNFLVKPPSGSGWYIKFGDFYETKESPGGTFFGGNKVRILNTKTQTYEITETSEYAARGFGGKDTSYAAVAWEDAEGKPTIKLVRGEEGINKLSGWTGKMVE